MLEYASSHNHLVLWTVNITMTNIHYLVFAKKNKPCIWTIEFEIKTTFGQHTSISYRGHLEEDSF